MSAHVRLSQSLQRATYLRVGEDRRELDTGVQHEPVSDRTRGDGHLGSKGDFRFGEGVDCFLRAQEDAAVVYI